MSGTAGKKARVKVATTSGGTYNNVQGADNISHEIMGENVDVSEFTVDYTPRNQGMKDGKYSLSGNLRMDDTNGQLVIRSAFLNDTPLFVRVLPDDGVTVGAGVQQEVKVASWKVDTAQRGKAAWSCELEGSGAITTV